MFISRFKNTKSDVVHIFCCAHIGAIYKPVCILFHECMHIPRNGRGEISPIPRYVHAFMEKYANRLVYGTDMGTAKDMYHITFRILETADEHFYKQDIFNYHWPLYGLAL